MLSVFRRKDGRLDIRKLIAANIIGGLSLFDKLYNQATVVGSPALPLTCDRDDPRKSIIDGTDVLADVADLVKVNGIFVSSSLKGDENGCTTIVEDWDNFTGGNVSTPGAGLLVAINSVDGNKVIDQAVAVAGQVWTATFNLELVSGDPSGFQAGLGENGGGSLDETDISDMSIGETRRISGTGTISGGVTAARIIGLNRVSPAGTGTATIRITNPRLVQSSAPAAGFPDGSPAGTDYPVDILTCTPVWTPAGTIMQAAIPYGYSGANNPADPDARFFETQNTFVYIRPGATIAGGSGLSPGLSTGGSVVDGDVSCLSLDWDGVNIGARYSTNARVSSAEADVPTGWLRIGTDTATTRPFHGALVTLIWPRVLTDAEYEIVRAGLVARLGGLTLV